jgi:hypothetical protein
VRRVRLWNCLYLVEVELLELTAMQEDSSELQLTGYLWCNLVDRVFQLYLGPLFLCRGVRVRSVLHRGTNAAAALGCEFDTLPDTHLRWDVPQLGTLVVFVGEDKADKAKLNADRVKLEEQLRFAYRSILNLCLLDSSTLEDISVFGLLNAGTSALLLELGWSGQEENFYLVREVASFDLRLAEDVRRLCKHLLVITELALRQLDTLLAAKEAGKHSSYVIRPYRSAPPATTLPRPSTPPPLAPGGTHEPTFSPLKYGMQPKKQLHQSSKSAVYEVTRPAKSTALKIGPRAEVEREAALLKRLGGRCHITRLLRGPLRPEAAAGSHAHMEEAALELPLLCDRRLGSLDDLAAFAFQACEAGAYLHSHGLLHGDFKRANMLWDGKRLTIIDLDCAIVVQREGEGGKQRPQCYGTYGYRPPEVQAATLAPAFPADVWSLGIVLAFEALELLRPGTSLGQLVLQQDLPRGLAALDRALGGPDHQLCRLLRSMLREAPEERATMEQLLDHPFIRPCSLPCFLRARSASSAGGMKAPAGSAAAPEHLVTTATRSQAAVAAWQLPGRATVDLPTKASAAHPAGHLIAPAHGVQTAPTNALVASASLLTLKHPPGQTSSAPQLPDRTKVDRPSRYRKVLGDVLNVRR